MNVRQPMWKQRGLGIIEVMVSIAVGLFILAGVLQLYATSSQNSAVVNGSSTIQENARYTFSRLAQDMSQAGYAGCTSYSNMLSGRIENLVDPVYAAKFQFEVGKFIWGENDKDVGGKKFDSVSVSYAKNASRARVLNFNSGTRTIVVDNSTDFKEGDLFVIANCSHIGVFRATAVTQNTKTISYAQKAEYNTAENFGIEFLGENNDRSVGYPVASLYKLEGGAVSYYVDTSKAGKDLGEVCSDTTPEYCALFRKINDQDAGELVEGVNEFSVEYGRRLTDGTLEIKDAAAISAVPANWREVDRVNLKVTLNSINKTPTNEGVGLIERTYTRTFFLFNQIPGAL